MDLKKIKYNLKTFRIRQLCFHIQFINHSIQKKKGEVMLTLKNISKRYQTGDENIEALNDINIQFRDNEFVSILGPSGCGKTTMLNIIGGLDQYTSGDLIISGKSTKEFKDRDWDTYRNHQIGFVFQSYNLIMHQSVLANVELALTLSGVSKSERRSRAKEALKKVGLEDQIHKKPNQMSGGQMQRVAIARALVNNPEILLADEPTGALDSVTSVQIMDLLKEIAKDRLVIMVTHNPELAEQYSTRIIKLLDGKIIDDSNPYIENPLLYEPVYTKAKVVSKIKKQTKTSMSFFTALSLSLNNLMTKKARTALTSFAGSIGIIGIALILSVSSGVNLYIESVEHSTMSSYPLQITENTMDSTAMMASFMDNKDPDQNRDPNKVYSSDIMIDVMTAMTSGYTTNNLFKLRNYIEDKNNGFYDHAIDVKYSYKTSLHTYSIQQANNNIEYKETLSGIPDLLEEIGMGHMAGGIDMIGNTSWQELVGDQDYIQSQYNLIYGKYPTQPNEIVIIVDKNNQITDFVLYTLGIRDINEVKEYLQAVQESEISGTDIDYQINPTEYSFEEICNYKFKILLDTDYYIIQDGLIVKRNEDQLKEILNNAIELSIVGIISPTEASNTTSIGCLGYTSDLMKLLIQQNNGSDIIKLQTNNPDKDMFTGLPFVVIEYSLDDASMLREQAIAMNPEMAPMINMMSDEQIVQMANATLQSSKSTYENNMYKLGYVDIDYPNTILIYPKDFESKDQINNLLSEYNSNQSDKDKISYSDTVALLMSSVTTIINAISYVLIAFVAISLIVSSIMIGIITYISVLERTKEIGVLRSIGASKKDISRVFNAETLIVGFAAGSIGIGSTLILNILINIVLNALTGLETLKAVLPTTGGVILILISMGLTLIAGLLPASIAAKKDPVVALRSE